MRDLLVSREFQIGVLTGAGGLALLYGSFVLLGVLLRPWIMAKAAHVTIAPAQLIGMWLRKVDVSAVVAAYIGDHRRGGRYSLAEIEATYLAFGDDIDRGASLLELADREAARRAKGGSS